MSRVTTDEEIVCRICLNRHCESDLSKLRDNLRESEHDSLDQLVRPCRCSGSIGYIHRGCLLLEIYYRRQTTCHLCRVPFQCVKLSHWTRNTLAYYLVQNKTRSALSVLYVLALAALGLHWLSSTVQVELLFQSWQTYTALALWSYLAIIYHRDFLVIFLPSFVLFNLLLLNLKHYSNWVRINPTRVLVELT